MPERAFQGLLSFLEEKYETKHQKQIARKLKLRQSQVSAYQNKAPKGLRWWRYVRNRFAAVLDRLS